jgi:hypothetical protein
MNTKKLIEQHKIPCGPMAVGVEGVCRRRLRDHFDALLDRLTKETHPEGVEEEILEVDEVEIPEEPEEEESEDEKKKRMIAEGKLKAEVKHEVEKYKEKLMGNSKMLQSQSGKLPKK